MTSHFHQLFRVSRSPQNCQQQQLTQAADQPAHCTAGPKKFCDPLLFHKFFGFISAAGDFHSQTK